MLKEQKKAADEQNQHNLDTYKILRQERDSMVETLQQDEASIFGKRSPSCTSVSQILSTFCVIELICSFVCRKCSSYWFNQVSSSAKGMHGSRRQLRQHRRQAGQGDCQAPQ